MKFSIIRRLQAVSIVAAVLSVGALAMADTCKSPNVKVVNDKSTTIKVTKIQYYDSCDKTWRTEDVAAREITSGGSTTWTDDLEYVGNCSVTKFKIYRAVRAGTGKPYGSPVWGSELVPDGGAKVCNTGVTYTIHAHE